MASPYGETPIGLSSVILNMAGVLMRKFALKVPRYQRPYCWTDLEVRRLVQDLMRAYRRGATFYFIGQIVLVKDEQGKLEISDGQQRLATLTMLIAYVRDRMPQRAAHYQPLIMLNVAQGIPRLILRGEDASFFRGYVQEPNNMSQLAGIKDSMGSDSRDLMVVAARTIASELSSMQDRELDQFMAYILRCTTLNVIDADERGCAATVYNTVNDRGLELSAADILKCDLLENSRLSPAEADQAAEQWEHLEDELGRHDFAKLLTQMPFLLTGEDIISPGDLAAFRNRVEVSGGVRDFLTDQLPRYATALHNILHLDVSVGDATADVNRRIKMLTNTSGWHWTPAAIAFLAEFRGAPEIARRFFQKLDLFTYACEFAAVDARDRAKRFAAAVELASEEKVYSTGSPLDLDATERRKLIWRLNQSYKRDRQQRMLLLRVEAAMKGGSVLSLYDNVSVEHVLPKGSAQWWGDRFPDKRMREEAANMMGNLALLTPRQNKAAGNKAFAQKKEIYFRTPGAPLHAVTAMLQNADDWTYDIIGERHERMVSTLCADWNLTPDPN